MSLASELLKAKHGLIAASTEKRCCPKHGPYEATVSQLFGRMITSICDHCLLEERIQAQKDHYANLRATAMTQRLAAAAIPLRFRDKDLTHFLPRDESAAKVLSLLQSWLNQASERIQHGSAIILSGPVGTGKTHLAVGLIKAVIEAGYSALFATALSFLSEVKASYTPSQDRYQSEAQVMKRYLTPQVLVLDEIGIKIPSHHDDSLLFDLINRRYEAMKTTVILSNLPPKELQRFLGERIWDRLRDQGGLLITLMGRSYRGHHE